MLEFHDDDDAATNWLERRWFAASAAVEAMEAECDTLREVRSLADDALRQARMQLAELTAVRDSLGERLANPQAVPEFARQPSPVRCSLSAA